jgi:hypothetical protein
MTVEQRLQKASTIQQQCCTGIAAHRVPNKNEQTYKSPIICLFRLKNDLNKLQSPQNKILHVAKPANAVG